MVTVAQRIEELRTEKGLSRLALSAELGFPKNALERFETGRQTPSKEQQEKMANFFGVSIFYLLGESKDRTRQDNWMDGTSMEMEKDYNPTPAPKPTKSAKPPKDENAIQGNLLEAVLVSKQAQELLRTIVIDTLKSPEGQALIEKAVRKALPKQ